MISLNRVGQELACVLMVCMLASLGAGKARALVPESWNQNMDSQWDGHFKARGTASWPDDQSIFGPVGTGTYYDGNTEARFKSKLFFGEWGYFETHYEAVLSGGDRRRKGKELEKALPPGLWSSSLLVSRPVEDDRRFLDLTETVDDSDDHILYHRLDRLSLTLLPKWGPLRLGRQAVTWGNGLLFNPMDLFNPFSPTDIERDYKIGDDMVSTQFAVDKVGDFQLLYVPRRDPTDRRVEWDQSSLAALLHLASGTTEFDIMAAKHFEDNVVGLGSTGYLGDVAWRLDATWTFLAKESGSEDYLSLVANMDYSWVWWERNFYGYLECFYNGLGDDQYPEALSDPDISERFDRGELFTLGRTYMAGHIRMEVHPLLNVYVTIINNLEDPSGTLQPRAVWDMTQNVQITFGGNVYYGAKGTEYGGFKMPGTDFLNKPLAGGFLWFSYFF
ncbi:MAG: hypothetical protein SWE60_09875 [Thermodesulfobacteriota bacterium]|nr:hypothetical protein [Thermodesulfobacteriota bacterium]